MNNKLISCLNCGVVFNTMGFKFDLNYRLTDLKEQLNKEPLNNDDLNIIYYNWVDIEQTEEEYLKYCPICKKWGFFKEVL